MAHWIIICPSHQRTKTYATSCSHRPPGVSTACYTRNTRDESATGRGANCRPIGGDQLFSDEQTWPCVYIFCSLILWWCLIVNRRKRTTFWLWIIIIIIIIRMIKDMRHLPYNTAIRWGGFFSMGRRFSWYFMSNTCNIGQTHVSRNYA